MIMKNLIRKMLLVMCVTTFALAFTACGKSDKSEPAAAEEEKASKDVAEDRKNQRQKLKRIPLISLLPANMHPWKIF